MNIMITGATGFVGRALCLRLRQDGQTLQAVVRDPARARATLPADTALVGWSDEPALRAAVLACEAIIHLAGEPIIGKRWTDSQKAALRDSRIATAQTLQRLTEMRAAAQAEPLALVVGASAIGYYGDCGDREADESSAAGSDFAAQLCQQWEEASLAITADRHVIVRIGLVLGRGGGMLAAMTPSFKRGLGAILGDGRAWQSWIHLDDLVEIVATAVRDASYAGVYNATAPRPVTSKTFAEALAAAFGKKARISAPKWLLRAALGEAAELALASTKALPTRLLATSFSFRFETLRDALVDLYQ